MDTSESNTNMVLGAIYLYPLKGARGLAADHAAVTARGLAGDRLWMIVEGNGRFVSQRSHPALALLEVHHGPEGLDLAHPGRETLRCPEPDGSRRLEAAIWKDTVDAADAGDEAAAWLTELLGGPCRLVYQDDARSRPLPAPRGREGDVVSFADGSPVLLCGEAALADLNGRLDAPLPLDRFRPNLVFRGGPPFAEDGFGRLSIGEVVFRNTGPCPRCTVTTVDQATGLRGKEPLRTLATYRKREGGVMFGVNLVPENTGRVAVGDPLVLLD